MERALSEAIKENNRDEVSYYFLESRAQFTKHAALMIVHITLALGLYSAGFYFVYSANVNGLSTSNTAGMILNFMFLGPLEFLNIVSTARLFDRSQKTKEKAKAYLVRTLGAETFEKIKNLKFTSAGIAELIKIFPTIDEEEPGTTSFLSGKLEEHEQQEKARRPCCFRALHGSLLVREGE